MFLPDASAFIVFRSWCRSFVMVAIDIETCKENQIKPYYAYKNYPNKQLNQMIGKCISLYYISKLSCWPTLTSSITSSLFSFTLLFSQKKKLLPHINLNLVGFLTIREHIEQRKTKMWGCDIRHYHGYVFPIIFLSKTKVMKKIQNSRKHNIT